MSGSDKTTQIQLMTTHLGEAEKRLKNLLFCKKKCEESSRCDETVLKQLDFTITDTQILIKGLQDLIAKLIK